MVSVVNDTGINIVCNITIGEKHYLYNHGEGSCEYGFQNNEQIEIVKEDIWASNHMSNKLFLMLYSLDMIFGNLSDSENLPFEIAYEKTLQDDSSPIVLSEILSVNSNSLKKWSNYSLMQCHFVTLLIMLIGILLSLAFTGWLQIVFSAIMAVLSVIVMVTVNSRRKHLMRLLEKHISVA